MYFTRFAFAQFVLELQHFVVDAYFALLLFQMIFGLHNGTGRYYAKKIFWFFFLLCLIYEFSSSNAPTAKSGFPFLFSRKKIFIAPIAAASVFDFGRFHQI